MILMEFLTEYEGGPEPISEPRTRLCEQYNTERLDEILVCLCAMVVDGQKKSPEHYGMVAAAVLDQDNNCVAALNYRKGDKDVHGERAAIDAYRERFGRVPQDSIIITTCSPCSETMSDRYGESCTDLINSLGVQLVYAGYADPTQPSDHADFTVEVSDNSKIHELCHCFAATFLDQEREQQLDELSFLGSPCTKDCSGHRAGYEWSKRKGLRLGNSPWSPSFNKGAALAVAGRE